MDNIFLILGYGVPADMDTDLEYRSYLAFAFNQIFERSRAVAVERVCVIFCGGRTDMFPPYRRSEAGEMKRYFTKLARRDFVRAETRDWTLLTETASLSTLENLLNAKRLIERRGFSGKIGIFCEFTRHARIKRIARLLFGRTEVVPVDFSLSTNRYLSADYLREKEKNAVAFDRWALESDDNFKKYHENFVEKFAFLRSYDPDKREEAIRAWWENEKDRELQEGVLVKTKKRK